MTGTRNSDWDKATESSCCGWLKSLFMDNFRERERVPFSNKSTCLSKEQNTASNMY